MAKATQSRGWWPRIIGVGVVFLVGIVLGAAGKVSVDGEPDCTPPRKAGWPWRPSSAGPRWIRLSIETPASRIAAAISATAISAASATIAAGPPFTTRLCGGEIG